MKSSTLNLTAVIGLMAMLAVGTSARADVLLSDEFDRDDVNIGENWDDNEDFGGTAVEATTATDPDGHVFFEPNQKMWSKIIPTYGFKDLYYSQTASFAGGVETSDELFIRYQTPGGALTDIATVYHPNGNVTNQPLGPAAEDAYFRMAYAAGDLFGDERVLLDNMSLDATPTGAATAEDIYFNQFTDNSDLANWALASDSGGSMSQNVTALQMRGSGSNVSVTRTIDTTNYENLALLVTGQAISLEGYQDETFFIEYSTDNGSNWTVLDSGDSSARLEAFVSLPAAAENNPNFMVRGRVTKFSRSNEYARIDMLHLVGMPIPEPGTLALLGLGGLAALVRRRRA